MSGRPTRHPSHQQLLCARFSINSLLNSKETAWKVREAFLGRLLSYADSTAVHPEREPLRRTEVDRRQHFIGLAVKRFHTASWQQREADNAD